MKLEQIVGLDEAKKVLHRELTLRAVKDQPQKMILLEGASGCAKTTLVEAITKEYMDKYPNRFVYKYLNVYDVSAHVTSTAVLIHNYFFDLRCLAKPVILFVDEVDEIMSSRQNAGHIKTERTTTLMKEINNETPNLLIIAATNRPKMIDRAVLDRFHRRVNCPMPTDEELSKIIDLHLSFLTQEQRLKLFQFMLLSDYSWNGRDIKHLSDELITVREAAQIVDPDYTISTMDIATEFGYIEHSKAHLKDDYLENQDE